MRSITQVVRPVNRGVRSPESPGSGPPPGRTASRRHPDRLGRADPRGREPLGPAAWIAAAVVGDLLAVAVYVLVGRSSHGESLSPGGLLSTAWPFIVGVAGGYVGIAVTGWPAASPRGGAMVVVKTLVIGLALRYGVQGAGTPLPYVVVTVLVLTALMGGWRLALPAGERLARLHR